MAQGQLAVQVLAVQPIQVAVLAVDGQAVVEPVVQVLSSFVIQDCKGR